MTQDLETAYEKAEANAQAIMADKDQALAEVRDKYDDKLRHATDQAAAAQKAFLDAEALEALQDRPDGDKVAEALGLS